MQANVITWSDLMKIFRASSGNPDFDAFSQKAGIPVERIKNIEAGIEIPNESDIELLKNTSEQSAELLKIFTLENVPYKSRFLTMGLMFLNLSWNVD